MTAARGLGWVCGPTPTQALVMGSYAHVASAGAVTLPEACILSRPLWVQNQGGEESCTAQMGAGMIYELTGEKCDAHVPWWAARDYDAPFGPLANVGCTTDGFLLGLEQHGACPMSEWDGTGYDILTRPPVVARIAAQKRRLDIQSIYQVGADAVRGACKALVDGLPVGVVVNVDAGYDTPTNGRVGPQAGPSRGQHAVRVRGYETDADGVIWFRSPGSWGTGYGLGGEVLLHESRIATSPWLGFATGCT